MGSHSDSFGKRQRSIDTSGRVILLPFSHASYTHIGCERDVKKGAAGVLKRNRKRKKDGSSRTSEKEETGEGKKTFIIFLHI